MVIVAEILAVGGSRRLPHIETIPRQLEKECTNG
jgi:hypothetical protein